MSGVTQSIQAFGSRCLEYYDHNQYIMIYYDPYINTQLIMHSSDPNGNRVLPPTTLPSNWLLI